LAKGAYYERADTQTFHQTLKEAIRRRGLPAKLYTDQGAAFTSDHTRIICANLGIRLLHAKPYHAWSKGKVERLFRTIQQGFEVFYRSSLWQAFKYVAQPRIGLLAVGIGSFDQAIDLRTGRRAVGRVTEQPIFTLMPSFA
jgi:transposase InsO family protein